MRESVGSHRPANRPPETRPALTTAVALAALFAGSGCSGDGGPREGDALRERGSGGDAGVARVELDCVLNDYPCTWAEVDSTAWTRTGDLVREAMDRLDRGATTEHVAEWLRDEPDMGSVLYDSMSVRFRIASGRPVWVVSPEAGEQGWRGPAAPPPPAVLRAADVGGGSGGPALQAAQKADPVGSQASGARPVKSVLFLDPYRWEFYLDVIAGIIPVGDDESNTLPRIFRSSRDYQCVPGKPCPCPAGQCYRYVGNDWASLCDPDSTSCNVNVNVTLDDFRSWKEYDVIHVVSHGTTLCDDAGENCASAIASGRFVLGDFRTWAESASHAGYPPGTEWLHEPGIELWRIGLSGVNPGICSRLTRGTPGYTHARCGTGQDVWREYLGVDFFKAAYKPGELKDKLIFLSSCLSVAESEALSDYLAPPGGENVVIGWKDYVKNGAMSRAATVFYTEWMKGKTAREAFTEVKADARFNDLAFRGDGLLRGPVPRRPQRRPTAQTAAAPVAEGLPGKRGVETVRLLDPASRIEVPDGGALPLTTRPGDGRPDTLDALLEVVSVDSLEDAEEYLLRVRVDGRDVPATARLQLDMGGGTHRYRGRIDVGQDLEPDVPIDVEVSADLPAGGETRWLYYDLVPVQRDCWWTTGITGDYQRHVTGSVVALDEFTVGNTAFATVNLGHPPGAPGTEALTFYLPDLAEGDYPINTPGSDGRIMMSTPEIPFGVRSDGMLRLSLVEPGQRVVGGFVLQYRGPTAPDLETRSLELRGQFVWTPGCADLGIMEKANEQARELLRGRVP